MLDPETLALAEAMHERMEDAQELAAKMAQPVIDGQPHDILTVVMAAVSVAMVGAAKATNDVDVETARYVKKVASVMAAALVNGGRILGLKPEDLN